MAHVCFMAVVVTGNVCCLGGVVLDSVFSLGVLKYVCIWDVIDVVFSVLIVRHGAGAAHFMGSVSVLLCRCCMFVSVSCVHPLAVINATFCITCRLLMLVEDGRCILQTRSHDCLIGSHECLLMFSPLFVEVSVRVLRCSEFVCCM